MGELGAEDVAPSGAVDQEADGVDITAVTPVEPPAQPGADQEGGR